MPGRSLALKAQLAGDDGAAALTGNADAPPATRAGRHWPRGIRMAAEGAQDLSASIRAKARAGQYPLPCSNSRKAWIDSEGRAQNRWAEGATFARLMSFFYRSKKSSLCLGTILCAGSAPSHTPEPTMAKIVCVLYDDPVSGYRSRTRAMVCPGSRSTPTARLCRRPKVSTSSRHLAGQRLRRTGSAQVPGVNGHQLVVTSSKDGADSVLDKELVDAEIVISQPFWPAYMTAGQFTPKPGS